MPAAKKPATATSSARSRNGTPAASRPTTRRDVERQIARVEKLLGDAGDALQLLGKDMGRGAGDAYKELVRTAKALRRDAQRTNKRMLKDFDKLRDALTPPVRRDARRAQPHPLVVPEKRTHGVRRQPRLGPRGPAPSPTRSRQPRRDAPGVPPAR